MLPKKFRLTYWQFYRNPHKKEKLLLLQSDVFIKKSEVHAPRFVIIVPKIIDKRSAIRHKIKRIIVEAIRKNLTNNLKFVDLLIKIKVNLKDKHKYLYDEEIKKLFLKLHELAFVQPSNTPQDASSPKKNIIPSPSQSGNGSSRKTTIKNN
ncbi:hypothetical protein COV53_04880 [Candidatus Gottesmanbacteria bacterium CG11_big_fil_rev_8_21_14_0_20_37_11]|uniref:Uncharacterized protein n=2 Tax=Candidatus Gottesmaniibacteriota TaxID=1752720 RepID=A0A2M7RT90_9BACT|nr:MAG: hypothetical protein COX23_03100 [Candidatus Gottesmanbacteria bacterium CG23_combo_of_CG06-09_8_20_14_all_37_19]PIR08078.1 MAG: hypothetical protein COV53_04880 [Candidatus Gottesmanbacteria bacterium CG11_big_fil_rev_8_21_14_0_20_37_11]PIZ03315.1 MAG: hypothetical protein COY59_00140 [Candidatus Gottesmanbacteria bacterium CG_4_10_14_0_8_um_filter_37_24]